MTFAYLKPLLRCPSIHRARRAFAFSLLVGTMASLVQAGDLPKVGLFTTGGSIQAKGAHRDKLMDYNDGKVSPAELVADVPELKSIANVEIHEVSDNSTALQMRTDVLLTLARELNQWLAQPSAAGAVVTHGTATLEETAYFLNLVIKSEKPVVVVGAMRPFTAISRDGPFNLYNAVRVAATPSAGRKGVFVLLNDEVHAARDVTKGNTNRVNTFESRDYGPLGFADSDRVVFYRQPLYRHTFKSEFDVATAKDLPAVEIVYGYQEANRAAIDAFVASGAKGIIFADSAASFPTAIKDGQAKGVVFVAGDRKGSGRVMLSAKQVERGVVTADNLNPQKARILLRLALTQTSDPKEIQRIFNEY